MHTYKIQGLAKSAKKIWKVKLSIFLPFGNCIRKFVCEQKIQERLSD